MKHFAIESKPKLELDAIFGVSRLETVLPPVKSLKDHTAKVLELALNYSDGTAALQESFMVPVWDAVISPSTDSAQEAALRELFKARPNAEALLRCLTLACQTCLPAEVFLSLEPRLFEFQTFAQRVQLALRLHTYRDVLANSTAESFQMFCTSLDSKNGQALAEWKESLHGFYGAWSQSLERLDRGIGLLEFCHDWAWRITGRFECTQQEWSFLLGTIENTIFQANGQDSARILHKDLAILSRSLTRFELTGTLVRSLESGKLALPNKGWKSVLFAALGEVLLQPNEMGLASPLAKHIAHIPLDQEALEGVKSAAFQKELSSALSGCRAIVERSWSDWLEEVMIRLHLVLASRESWGQNDKQVKAACDRAAGNLREALEVYRNSRTLEKELFGLLWQAELSRLTHISASQASISYRTRFLSNYLDGNTSVSTVKATISALKTSLKQSLSSDLYAQLSDAIELLEALPTYLSEVQPQIAQLKPLIYDGQAGPEQAWTALLERSRRDQIRTGGSFSLRTSLEWFLTFELPSLESSQWSQLMSVSAGASGQAALNSALTSALISESLWNHSQEIADKAAQRIYEELPDYAQQTAPPGVKKCARDTSLSLRRVSLALLPGVTDPFDYFSSWWNSTVNQYIATRPNNLFRVTLSQILYSCRTVLGPEATDRVESIIEPSYSSAGRDSSSVKDEGSSQGPVYRPLKPGFLGAQVAEPYLTPVDPDFVDFLQSNVGAAHEYSKSGWTQTNQKACLDLLEEGRAHYDLTGSLSPAILKRSRRLTAGDADNLFAFERFCIGYLYRASDLQWPACLVRVDYFQAWIELLRHGRLATELSQNATQVASKAAAWLHSKGTDLSQGVSAPNEAKCARDLGHILNHVAHSWENLPTGLVEVEIRRYALDMVSPYIGYGLPVWKQTLTALRNEGLNGLSASLKQELIDLSLSLENSGAVLQQFGPAVKSYVCSEDAIFSANPAEETEWRQLVSGIFVFTLMSQSSSLSLGKERLWLLGSLGLLQKDWELPDKLDALKGFFEEQLSEPLRSQFNAQADMVAEILRNWKEISFGLKSWATAAPQSTHRNGCLQLLMMSLGLSGSASTRWGLSSQARISLGGVDLNDSAQFSAFPTAMGRILPVIPTLTTKSQEISHSSYSSIWSSASALIQGQLPFDLPSGAAKTCARDGAWHIRRALLEGWSGSRGQALNWMQHEVSPFYSAFDPQIHSDFQARLCEVVASASEKPESLFAAQLELHLDTFSNRPNPAAGAETFVLWAPVELSESQLSRWSKNALPDIFSSALNQGKGTALDYAAKFSKFSDYNWERYLAKVLKGFSEFEFQGEWSAETYASIRADLRGDGAPLFYERLCQGLIYSVSDQSLGLTSRLRLVDMLQHQVECQRQIQAGFEIEAQLKVLAGRASQLRTQGVLDQSSPESNGPILEHLLCLWSRSLQTLPLSSVRWTIATQLLQLAAAGRGPAASGWAEIFRILSSQESLSPVSQRFFAQELAFAEVLLPKLENSTAFYAEQPEWGTWSSSASEIRGLKLVYLGSVATAALREVDGASGHSATRQLAYHARVHLGSELAGNAERLERYLRETFLDNDLRPVLRVLEHIVQDDQRAQELVEGLASADSVAGKVCERMGTLVPENLKDGVATLLFSVSRLGSGEYRSTRWSVPFLLKGIEPKTLEHLRGLSSKDCERLETALDNLLGTRFPHSSRNLRKLHSTLLGLSSVDSAWNQSWSIGGTDFNVQACQRDLHWLVRRIAVSAWSKSVCEERSFEWYQQEVVPYVGKLSLTVYSKAIRSTVHNLKALKELNEDGKQLAQVLQNKIDALIAAAKPDELPSVALLRPLPSDWDQPRKKSIWNRLSDSFESLVG